MAVGYRSSSRSGASDSSGASCTVPVPAGAAAGDIAILAIELWETYNVATFTWPTGFAGNEIISTSTGGIEKLRVAWKRLSAGDTGSYVPTWTGGNQWNQGDCILITGGIASGNPIEDSDFTTATGTTMPNIPAVVTATLPFLVHIIANENAASGTPPTSYTEVQEGDYIRLNYRIPGVSGSHTAPGGSISVSSAKIGALIAIKPEPTGGTNYTDTVTNTAGASDTASAVLTVSRSPVDGLGVADSTAVQRDVVFTVADTLGATDTVSRDRVTATSDSAGLLDTAATAFAVFREQVDTSGLADTVTVERQVLVVVTDQLGTVDSSLTVSDAVRDVLDALGVTDIVASEIVSDAVDYDETVTDAAGLLDTTERLAESDRIQVEPAGLTDTAASTIDGVRAPVDGVGLTDDVVAVRQVFAEVVSGLGLTDAVDAASDAANERTVFDGVGVTDDVELAATMDHLTSDNGGLVDTAEVEQGRAVVDSAGVTDDVSVTRQMFAEIVDGAGLADSTQVQASSSGGQTIVDPAGVTDDAGTAVTAERAQLDVGNVTDQVLLVRQMFAEIVDSAGLSDAVEIGVPPPVPSVLIATALPSVNSLANVPGGLTLSAVLDPLTLEDV